MFLEASDYAEIVEEEGDYSTPGSEYQSIPAVRLRSRLVKGHIGHVHDEAMEAEGREFDPRPGHYSRMSF